MFNLKKVSKTRRVTKDVNNIDYIYTFEPCSLSKEGVRGKLFNPNISDYDRNHLDTDLDKCLNDYYSSAYACFSRWRGVTIRVNVLNRISYHKDLDRLRTLNMSQEDFYKSERLRYGNVYIDLFRIDEQAYYWNLSVCRGFGYGYRYNHIRRNPYYHKEYEQYNDFLLLSSNQDSSGYVMS